jgi:hypothetical protein
MIGRLAIFPSLILALLAAGSAADLRAAAAETAAPAASGDVVLASAVARLAHYTSVSASLRQRVGLFGRNLFGSGQYVQSGIGARRQFRMEMTIQGKRQKTSTTRICDGRLLWLMDEVAGQSTLRVVDLRRVEDALAQADMARVVDWRRFDLGFGGLPRLLASCEENFQFAAATPSQLNEVPVWVLRGHWKPERLKQLVAGPGKDGGKDQAELRLPQHIPNEVVLYLGRDDLFPYCVEYRSVGDAKNNQGPEVQILAAMDFFDVRIDTPVDEKQFTGPANMAQTDDTEAFLTRLGIPRTPSEIRQQK